MVTSVCSCQTQLVIVMAVRYGGENKAALKHLLILSVGLHMHLKGQGENHCRYWSLDWFPVANDSILQFISARVMTEQSWCFRRSAICLLPHRAASVHRLACGWLCTFRTIQNLCYNSTLTDSLTSAHTWNWIILCFSPLYRWVKTKKGLMCYTKQ